MKKRDEVPEALDAEALGARIGVSSRTITAWIRAGVLPKPPHHGRHTRFPRTSIVIAHAVAALRADQVSLHQIRKFLRGKTDAELRELGGLPPAPPSSPPPALPANASRRSLASANASGRSPALPANASGRSPALPANASGRSPALPANARAGPRTAAGPALPADAGSAPDATLAGEVLGKEETLTAKRALAERRDAPEGAGVPLGSEWRRIELLPGLELHVRADASPFAHGIAAAIAAGRFTK